MLTFTITKLNIDWPPQSDVYVLYQVCKFDEFDSKSCLLSFVLKSSPAVKTMDLRIFVVIFALHIVAVFSGLTFLALTNSFEKAHFILSKR